jgi:hypothetical protein
VIETFTTACRRLAATLDLVAMERAIFVWVLPVFALCMAIHWLPGSSEGIDFRQFYAAAVRLLHGVSPYRGAFPQFDQLHAFVYPPLSAFVFVPFTLLPLHAAEVAFGVICIALGPAALWVLGVEDLRVYSVALIWTPAVFNWVAGNETALLVLLLALLWRHRDRPVAAGALVALMFSIKLMMWPLALWLLGTRRWRASAWGLATCVAVNAACWGIVGAHAVGPFLHRSSLDVTAYWRAGYSVAATLAPLGVAHTTGSFVTLLLSILLGAAALYTGWLRGDEGRSLTLTVLLVLVASPIVWMHYPMLLLVPLAIERPRFTWLWTLPIAMWLCPYPASGLWWRLFVWVLTGIIAAALLQGRRATIARLAIEPAVQV